MRAALMAITIAGRMILGLNEGAVASVWALIEESALSFKCGRAGRAIFASEKHALTPETNMNTSLRHITKSIGTGAMVLLLTGMVAHQAIPHTHGAAVKMPSDPEFGLGPRVSAGGLYSATLAPERALEVGKMQSVRVVLADPAGQPVRDARITVDGGMPKHGHGLPTRPVATPSPEEGVYEIHGVKFNMGGWWVLNLHIDAAAGPDTVTFNLAL